MNINEKRAQVKVALHNAFYVYMNEEYKNIKTIAQLTYEHVSKKHGCTWEEYYPGDWEKELIPFESYYKFTDQIKPSIVFAIYVEYDYNGEHVKKYLYGGKTNV